MPEINLSSLHSLLPDQLNCSIAIVKSVIVEKDEVLLRVILQPTGEEPLVRMSWDYTGPGFGMYVLPENNDEVLCVFPNGDINRGICIKRFNNGIDKIPKGISKSKILLIAKDGHDVDIELKGGNFNLTVNGTVNVDADTVNVDSEVINLAGGGPGVARVGDPIENGKIKSGSTKVFSG